MREHNPWTTRWLVIVAVAAMATLAACIETTPPPTANQPVIVSFGAEPSEIAASDSSTLSWTVTGSGVTLSLSVGATTLYESDDLVGSVLVSPTATTTYVLTATNTAGSVDADTTVTVTGSSVTPELTGLSAETVRLSQVALSWSVDGASFVEVYAAVSSAPDADATLVTTLAGNATGHTMPIPTSDRQTVRVCAVSGAERACDTAALSNVVTRADDYDPYYLEPLEPAPGDPARDVPWPEPEIPGTLRSLILNADEGAVIGFAADIDHILIRGVDLLFLDGPGYQDAHLILERNITISAPATGVTLEGVTAWLPGNPPGDPFTYRSRLIYVVEGTTVTLEHLTITGGTFIYRGGGIRNDGNLTILDSTITENRAWEVGGGIWNNATGTLLVERSTITDNQAVTLPEELDGDASYSIRRDPPDGYEIFMFDTGVGGGLFNQAGGSVTLIDSLVEGNVATEFGGGIYTEAGATTHLDDTIVTGNTPSDIVQASASASTSASTSSSHVVENERVRTR